MAREEHVQYQEEELSGNGLNYAYSYGLSLLSPVLPCSSLGAGIVAVEKLLPQAPLSGEPKVRLLPYWWVQMYLPA